MQTTFFGWRVVAGAFVLAVFGWGLGFYGPPVFLHAVQETRGWSTVLVSTAVTVHFLVGAIVVANLPGLYRRFGLPAVTRTGAVVLALGVVSWAVAREPWQLLLATLFSGVGWVAMGAAAVNAIVAPWFVARRPAALAMAYNGASIGGVVFSPLWVAVIAWLGFPMAAMGIGAIMVLTIWLLSGLVFAKTPESLGQVADGETVGTTVAVPPPSRPLARGGLWRDARFQTLAAGMALGLFAQIGLIAQSEFDKADAARVVPLIVAIGQGFYAFAPAMFGAIRALSPDAATMVFVAAAVLQALAIGAFLRGRRR